MSAQHSGVMVLRIKRDDDIPMAIAEFDEVGNVTFANENFLALFYGRVPADDPRHGHEAAAMLRAVLAHDEGAPVCALDDEQTATMDILHPWVDDRHGDSHTLEIRFPFPPELQDRQRTEKRHYQYYLRKRSRGKRKGGAYRIFLETITFEKRNQEMVDRTGAALDEKLRDILVEQKRTIVREKEAGNVVGEREEKTTPGLRYYINPERPPVGGDFVFDWSIRKTARVGQRMRMTMVGDAEAQSIVGGLMAANVGAVLKSVCLKPRDVLGSLGKSENPAKAVADHLNIEIIDHNTTGSRGLDGMILITELNKAGPRLHLSQGKFDIYLFDRNAKRPKDIERIGEMYPNAHVRQPKSFGRLSEQTYSEDVRAIGEETIVVAFSDGAGDVFQDAGYGDGRADFRSLIFEQLAKTLGAASSRSKRKMRYFVDDLALALKTKLDYCAGRVGECDDQSSERGDDELIFVLAPMHRPWMGKKS